MKRNTIVGLIAMVAVVVVAMSAGCNGPPPPLTPPPSPYVAPTQPPQQLPDLKVINIDVEPEPPIINGLATFAHGKSYDFNVEVKNVGQQSADIFEVSLTGVGTYTGVTQTGPIGVGGTKYATIYFTMPSPGTYAMQIRIDPYNNIQESDESEFSNIWKTTINVD